MPAGATRHHKMAKALPLVEKDLRVAAESTMPPKSDVPNKNKSAGLPIPGARSRSGHLHFHLTLGFPTPLTLLLPLFFLLCPPPPSPSLLWPLFFLLLPLLFLFLRVLLFLCFCVLLFPLFFTFLLLLFYLLLLFSLLHLPPSLALASFQNLFLQEVPVHFCVCVCVCLDAGGPLALSTIPSKNPRLILLILSYSFLSANSFPLVLLLSSLPPRGPDSAWTPFPFLVPCVLHSAFTFIDALMAMMMTYIFFFVGLYLIFLFRESFKRI